MVPTYPGCLNDYSGEYNYDLEYRVGKDMQVLDRVSMKPHPEGEQPSLRDKDMEQENIHMVIGVTTRDGTKHKVLLNLSTKKKEVQEEEIPKVFDWLFQTLDRLGEGKDHTWSGWGDAVRTWTYWCCMPQTSTWTRLPSVHTAPVLTPLGCFRLQLPEGFIG